MPSRSSSTPVTQLLTFVRCPKLVSQHALHHALHVLGVRVPRTIVDGRLVDLVVRRVASLEDVERSSHVTLGELEEGLFPVVRQLDPDHATPTIYNNQLSLTMSGGKKRAPLTLLARPPG
jgi:hypothetical protein